MPENNTPIRQQYLRVKRQYPQVIVFFRLGDFYETFDEDARTVSRELEIVLTSRPMGKGNSIPMAGIPYHAVDNYLARLINRGFKVAICEQTTKPGENKGLIDREVVRLVTPGTVVEPSLLSAKTNNYLASLIVEGDQAGLAYLDISTGEFATTQASPARALSELERLRPSEIIVPESFEIPAWKVEASVTRRDDFDFNLEDSIQVLMQQLGTASLDGYGCANLPLAIRAAGAALRYIRETQKSALSLLDGLTTYSTESYMTLDVQTQNNLELFRNNRTGKAEGSLLAVIDLTKTPMGGRLLRRWLGQPLLEVAPLERRLDAVTWFHDQHQARGKVGGLLSNVADLERLVNRVKSNIASPREVVALKKGLEAVPDLVEALADCPLDWLKEGLRPQPDIVELISKSLVDQPPSSLDEGGAVLPGFSPELDELRTRSASSKQYLANLEKQERERTGIRTLKVGYNRIFGYFIEVSNSNLSQVPQDYIRRQTLTNGERFFTPELKDYETQILHAQERIAEMEADIFFWICGQISAASGAVLELAHVLAELDTLAGLAEAAARHNYVRPALNTGGAVDIKDGRHPIVERSLPENTFIPNDTCLSNDDAQIVILTGPNMAGKSTYLRQVALIVLLAQIGSFVPASSAAIGIVDRIFTRIGAGEDLAAGKSTFMVEMTEAATILNSASPRSLIILDEIGRGTSTYDGLSIARAAVEYIHNNPRLGAKTLFATHYHELTGLAGVLPRVRNFNVAVTEERGEVIFLRKIVPGGVDKSYGIHVAKLAGLPRPVIQRAQEVLSELESRDGRTPLKKARPTEAKEAASPQLSLFGIKPPLLEEIEKLDIDSLTPLEALNKLYELQRKVKPSP